MRRAPKTPVKKPYHPPKFIIYGDLTQMTSTRFKGKGRLDGSGDREKHDIYLRAMISAERILGL